MSNFVSTETKLRKIDMENDVASKQAVAQAIINRIEENDKPVTIETGLFKNYNSPNKITQKDNGEGYTPDIKVRLKDNTTNFYEIVLKNEYNIEKWRILSSYAKDNNGKLILIVPDSLLDNLKKTLKDNNLKNIHIIYFHKKKEETD